MKLALEDEKLLTSLGRVKLGRELLPEETLDEEEERWTKICGGAGTSGDALRVPRRGSR